MSYKESIQNLLNKAIKENDEENIKVYAELLKIIEEKNL